MSTLQFIAHRNSRRSNVRISRSLGTYSEPVYHYDTALKSVLRRLTGSVLVSLTGFAIKRWHNVELPEVRNPHADMLGETEDGRIVHIELQSTNDSDMAVRMAEYALAIYRQFGRLPRQIVLYVGQAPLRMESALEGESLSFGYRISDIRKLDAEPLLTSDCLEENILAVLMRLGNEREAVRRILRHIAESEPARRGTAMAELTILAGLRKLGTVVQEETRKMPILDDIMDHDLFGPAIRRGMDIGREEGYQRGEQAIIARQIEKRFGPIPEWARERLNAMSASDVEGLAVRIFDARNLEELLN